MKRYHFLTIIVLLMTVSSLLGSEFKYNILYPTRKPIGVSESAISEMVDNALQWKTNGKQYLRARIKVFADKETLDYLVVYMFRADVYTVECHKIEVRRNNTFNVVNNYTEEAIPEEDEVCQTCPDETIQIVISTSETSSSHPANKGVKDCFKSLDDAGVKVKALYGSEESNSAIKNWLSCKNMKLWGRIGHGMSNGTIALGSGSLRPSEVSQMDLHHKFMIINSCFVHNQSMIPNMIDDADAYFFCSGDNVSLPMNTSEPVWHNIIKKGVLQGVEFGKAVKDAGNEGNMTKYGFTRNPDANGECFWADVIGLHLGLTTPNGGDSYVVGSSIDITWSTNAETKMSLYLLKGTNVYKTIVENTENDGEHAWVIPLDTDEGSDYKIRIETDTMTDESDEAFSIKKKPSIVCATDLLTASLDTSGSSTEKTLKIKNEGEGTLAYSIQVGGAGGIMVNELYIGSSEPADGFELRNMGPDQDMTGWKLIYNDDAQSSGEYEFESGYVFKSNTLIVCDDVQGSDFYLGDLKWAESTELSVSLLDASGKGVDFVRTAGNNDQPPAGTAWDGDGVENGDTYVYRNSNDDSDSKADWSKGSSGTIGELNPGQSFSLRADHWLSVDPEEGTVAPNQEASVTLTFNSEGLEIGEYHDTLLVIHDDPDKESPIAVPCKLTVSTNTGITVTVGKEITTYGMKYRGSMIAYQIPDRADGKRVSIKLYNLKGELVSTLLNGNRRSGYYWISLNSHNKGKALAVGNYICNMKTEGFTKAIIVLLK